MTTPEHRPGAPDHAHQQSTLKEQTQAQAFIDNKKQHDARFHALAAAIGSFAWTTTIDCQGLDMLGWSTYTGLPLAECQGNGWRKALHPADNELLLQEWKLAMEEHHVYNITCRIRRKDGRYSRCKVRRVPVSETGNEVTEWVWAANDLEEQPVLEQDMPLTDATTQNSTGLLAAAFEAARANLLALHEANRRMYEFLGIASHELRTPMTSITLYLDRTAQLLKTRPGPDDTAIQKRDQMLDKLQDMLTKAQIQMRRQHRLVNDLLDFSRIHNNWFNFQMERCNLVSLVQDTIQDTIEELQTLTPSRNIEMQADNKEITVIADTDRIRQVVSNYLSNALKYSTEDKPVWVRVQMETGNVRVEVQDKGRGLSPDEKEHIWEQFYRTAQIEKQNKGGAGLGLGLHICRSIIEKHNGRVGVSSQPGVGSTFWFTLPMAPPE